MKYTIALLPGDGIGPEVTSEAQKVAHAAALKYGFDLSWREFPFGASYYLKHKEVLPNGAFDDMAACDAMFLGAVGDPRVKPGPLEQGLLLALRFHFDQYMNLRPALSFPNVPLPVPIDKPLNIVVVRENTEDLYMGVGGRGKGNFQCDLNAQRGQYNLSGKIELNFTSSSCQSAFSLGLMTKDSIIRIAKKAFEIAKERNENKIHVITKANAVPHLYGFWDEVCKETATLYPEISCEFVNVDAMCYLLPRDPMSWGVLLCPNLFGDIVSDLVSALAGGLGLAASGNIGDSLSMFEPVHGSAPTLTNTGKANPLASILSMSMLFKHLGQNSASLSILNAVHDYLASEFPKPYELGGNLACQEVGQKVIEFIK